MYKYLTLCLKIACGSVGVNWIYEIFQFFFTVNIKLVGTDDWISIIIIIIIVIIIIIIGYSGIYDLGSLPSPELLYRIWIQASLTHSFPASGIIQFSTFRQWQFDN